MDPSPGTSGPTPRPDQTAPGGRWPGAAFDAARRRGPTTLGGRILVGAVLLALLGVGAILLAMGLVVGAVIAGVVLICAGVATLLRRLRDPGSARKNVRVIQRSGHAC